MFEAIFNPTIFFAGSCECIDSQGCLMDERRGGKHEHTWTFSSCSQQNFNKTIVVRSWCLLI